MTTPIAMRDERSGCLSPFSAASRAVADEPKARPTRRRTGGMTIVEPRASPVNDRRPPKNATTTPRGVTIPTRMPSASSTAPAENSAIAVMLRPGRRARSLCVRSTEPPSASSGVTDSTRCDPDQAAAHVVSTTTTAGTSSSGRTSGKGTVGRSMSSPAIATPTAATPVPASSPTKAPIAPTTRPWRATSARCDRADAPMRRMSAMLRTRPATIVANVLAVTIAATNTATPRSNTVRMPTTTASVPLEPIISSANRNAPI